MTCLRSSADSNSNSVLNVSRPAVERSPIFAACAECAAPSLRHRPAHLDVERWLAGGNVPMMPLTSGLVSLTPSPVVLLGRPINLWGVCVPLNPLPLDVGLG
jgi:hypothetical protein